jgi:hypothetical protein
MRPVTYLLLTSIAVLLDVAPTEARCRVDFTYASQRRLLTTRCLTAPPSIPRARRPRMGYADQTRDPTGTSHPQDDMATERARPARTKRAT